MPEKFPEKLPPKGEGRVDNKHRVALLTEPEIGALNFLKNMDRAMGYKSGFSPMMQNLAAQNTQPLEYVEYRGERIPSLNDFSEGGYGGGGDSGSSAGEQEARNQTSSGGDHGSSNSWTARMKREREERLRKEKEAYDKRAKELEDIERYIAEQRMKQGEFYGYGEGGTVDDLTRPEREPGSYGDPRVLEEGGYDYPDGTTPTTPYPDTPDDGGGDSNPYEVYPEFEAYDGSMHWTQEDANAANEFLTNKARSGKETELTDYGSTTSSGVYDEIASDFQTYMDDTLAGQRQTAYDQALAGLYDDQQLTGLWDEDAYNKALEGLDAAVEAESGELDQYGKSLKSGAEDAYNTWLAEQTAGLGELEYSDIGDWEWGDLDLSGFTDNQKYQDFNFLDEFKKIDPEGNTIEPTSADWSSFNPNSAPGTEEGGTEEGGAETSRTVTRKKKKYTPTYSSASLTGGGSSSNIS